MERLGKLAAAKGFQLDDLIVKMLEEQIPTQQLSVDEKRQLELLEKINMGLPIVLWERYATLKVKRQEETMTPSEQVELIDITDQIEQANAARMPFLIELAQLRNISLESLFQELDLKQ
jgi:hypothetical protein